MKLILKAITLSIMLLSIHPAYAQDFWQPINPPPADENIYAIEIAENGDIYVGRRLDDGGGVFRSSDNGQTWELLGLENRTIYSIEINELGHIFVGTNRYIYDHTIYRSIDNGLSWEGVYEGFYNPISMKSYPGGLMFAYNGTNNSRTIVRSIDYGNTWEIVIEFSTGEFVEDFAFQSTDTIYAGSTYWGVGGGGVYRSVDGGDSWENIGLLGVHVESLALNSSNDLYAGARSGSSAPGSVFLLESGSDQWVTLLEYERVTGIEINKNDEIFISCSAFDGIWGGGVRYSNDAGQTWVDISSGFNLYNGGETEKLELAKDGHLFALVYNSIPYAPIYRSTISTILTITNHPADQLEVCPNAEVVFSISGENIDFYQWQKSQNSGVVWEDIVDNEIYSGANTDSLIVNINLGNCLYRCIVSDEYENKTSKIAQLTIETQAPEIECIENQQVNADETHTYTVQGTEFDPISLTDNCELASLSNNINGEETLSGAILSEGNNTIIWTATDSANNISECSFTVFVTPYVGITECIQEEITIFPNPAKNTLYFSGIEKAIIKLYNLMGQCVIEQTITENSINISKLNKGIYWVEIQSGKKRIVQKIVKM